MAPKKKNPKKAPAAKAQASKPAAAKPLGEARLAAIEAKLAAIIALLEKGAQVQGKPASQPAAQAASLPMGAETASDPDSALFLSRTPLFAKLSPQECSILASYCEIKNVGAGQKLFSEGDFGDAMYILKAGVLEIFKKDLLGDVRIAEIRPGGLVGEMALVDGKPRSANVRAADSTRLLSLSRASYNDLKKVHPQVATKFQDELLLLISSRLRQTTEKLVGK